MYLWCVHSFVTDKEAEQNPRCYRSNVCPCVFFVTATTEYVSATIGKGQENTKGSSDGRLPAGKHPPRLGV